MRKAVLVHNPTAGSGEHSKKSLIKKIESAGYEVKYFSTDLPGWERFTKEKAHVIFVAGGDGTVQKLVAALLNEDDQINKVPVQILPMGTANNIAATLNLDAPLEKLIEYRNMVGFDVGKVKGAGDADFFIEALGFGIFPRLVKIMKEKEEEDGELNPDVELKKSLQELLRTVRNYVAVEAIIIADEEEITGKFLLIELMNIKFIGPHFELAPSANTGDGNFELIAVPEEAREDLAQYIEDLMENRKKRPLEDFAFLKKVKEVRIKWMGEDMHVDDERIEGKRGEEITAINSQAVFEFRIP